jgi:hypothetical protein
MIINRTSTGVPLINDMYSRAVNDRIFLFDIRIKQTRAPTRVPNMAERMEIRIVTFNPSRIIRYLFSKIILL